MTPPCGAIAAGTGLPCRKPGKFGGYCGHHRRCDAEGCDEPRWWACSPSEFCKAHAQAHAAGCRRCGDHYRRVATRYFF